MRLKSRMGPLRRQANPPRGVSGSRGQGESALWTCRIAAIVQGETKLRRTRWSLRTWQDRNRSERRINVKAFRFCAAWRRAGRRERRRDAARRRGATGRILLVSGEPFGPYGRTFLPKQFLLGALPKEKLMIHDAAYYRQRAIDIMPGVLAVAVDAPNRLVRTDCAGDFHFDKLLIATGTKPVR